MNKREKLLKMLRRQGYDEVLYTFALCPALEKIYRETTGSTLPYDEYYGFPWRELPHPVASDTDLTRFYPYHDTIDHSNTVIDEWGIGHRSTPSSMHMTQMLHPLNKAESVEELETYPLPVYREEDNTMIARRAKEIRDSGFAAVGQMQMTIWETAWYLRGMENLMMDMISEDEMAEVHLKRVEAGAISQAQMYARAGADIIYLGDDIGMQQSIMMSQPLYQTWIKPALTRVIRAAKEINPDVLIFYHSCGYIEPLIPDLIEAGIDVLNPIQPECMDFEKIHSLYGDVVSFHGTVGTQSTMPYGTKKDVFDAVEKHLRIAGPKGGLLIGPTHLLEPDVPWENVLYFMEACKAFQG